MSLLCNLLDKLSCWVCHCQYVNFEVDYNSYLLQEMKYYVLEESCSYQLSRRIVLKNKHISPCFVWWFSLQIWAKVVAWHTRWAWHTMLGELHYLWIYKICTNEVNGFAFFHYKKAKRYLKEPHMPEKFREWIKQHSIRNVLTFPILSKVWEIWSVVSQNHWWLVLSPAEKVFWQFSFYFISADLITTFEVQKVIPIPPPPR